MEQAASSKNLLAPTVEKTDSSFNQTINSAPESIGGDQPILFESDRDGNREIYKMNADGTNQQRLTNSPEYESGGRWSPGGQKILFIRGTTGVSFDVLLTGAGSRACSY